MENIRGVHRWIPAIGWLLLTACSPKGEAPQVVVFKNVAHPKLAHPKFAPKPQKANLEIKAETPIARDLASKEISQTPKASKHHPSFTQNMSDESTGSDYLKYKVAPGDTLGSILASLGVCKLWGPSGKVQSMVKINPDHVKKNGDYVKAFDQVFLPFESLPENSNYKINSKHELIFLASQRSMNCRAAKEHLKSSSDEVKTKEVSIHKEDVQLFEKNTQKDYEKLSRKDFASGTLCSTRYSDQVDVGTIPTQLHLNSNLSHLPFIKTDFEYSQKEFKLSIQKINQKIRRIEYAIDSESNRRSRHLRT